MAEARTPPKKVAKRWYKQRFNEVWLKDPLLKDWLREDRNEKGLCYCICCDKKLRNANKSMLVSHQKTEKHKKRAKTSKLEQNDDSGNEEIHSVENFFPAEVTNEVYGSHSVGSPKRIHISYLDHETSTPKVRKFRIITTDKQQPIVSNLSNETSTSFKPTIGDPKVLIVKNRSSENLTFSFPNEDSSDPLVPLVHNVANIFRTDLHNFLRKNDSVAEYIQDNPDFSDGDAGISRLTRMLVSQMAHQYLMDYTVESWNSRTNPNNSNLLSNKLSEIEKTMEHSVQEMKTIKAQFNADKLPNQSEILLKNLNAII